MYDSLFFSHDFLLKLKTKKYHDIFQDNSNAGDNTSEDEIDIFAHDQLVPNEVVHNQPDACEDVAMDEASLDV